MRSSAKVITAIIALRNEKGSYNADLGAKKLSSIIALRNEKGSYNGLLV